MTYRILIAEDEEVSLKHMLRALKSEGYDVVGVKDGLEALRKMENERFDILLADIKMPGMDGITLLGKVKKKYPDAEVLIITGFATIESAVTAMKKGAADYIAKPLEIEELILKLARILEIKRLENEIVAFKISLGLDKEYPLIASSHQMKRVVDIIRSIKESDCNVLITGESGVGKGLVAKLIHYSGLRKEMPFLALNCAIFTEELLASEMFGHERGAFTGAVAAKQGLIEIANRGTLFLDEIAEMPPQLQAKLLNVIEEKEFIRVGGTRPLRVDLRFIAATNQNMADIVKKKKFREDLYYRLNVMDISIPPLRERRKDIAPLARHFLKINASKGNKKIRGFADETMEILLSYKYPGNVRELNNIVERAVILEKSDYIRPKSLPQTIKLYQVEAISPHRIKSLEDIKREYARAVLEYSGGNKTETSKLLGISRTNLWRLLSED